MALTPVLIIIAIVVVVFVIKKAKQVSDKDALEYLKTGALVIDVRGSRGV